MDAYTSQLLPSRQHLEPENAEARAKATSKREGASGEESHKFSLSPVLPRNLPPSTAVALLAHQNARGETSPPHRRPERGPCVGADRPKGRQELGGEGSRRKKNRELMSFC